MQKNGYQWMLWALASVLVVGVGVTWPSHKQLNHVQNQVAAVKKQELHVTHTAKISSPVNEKFDVLAAEQTATKKLQQSFSLMLGEIQSQDNFKQQQKALTDVLGKRLVTRLVDMNNLEGSGSWQAYTGSPTVTVSFKDADDQYVVPVVVTVSAAGPDDRKANLVFNLTYDLRQQQVRNYKITQPTARVQEVKGE